MKTSKIFAIAALSLTALVGVAQAEEYQGVLSPVSALSRSEVQQQAVGARCPRCQPERACGLDLDGRHADPA